MESIHPSPAVRIWPGFAPGETTLSPGRLDDCSGGIIRVTDVTSPELFAYGACAGASKPAIIVCPGGGYGILAAQHEGSEIAEWLQGLGFVAFVLHYRCPDKRLGAYQDGRRAISWVRAHAAEYGVDRSRVGALGFSAGAHLVTRMAAQISERPYEPVDEVDTFDCRLDFALPIYPAYLIDRETGDVVPEVAPSSQMPPIYLAQSTDDPHFCAAEYAGVAKGAMADVTLATYPDGGHGYGMRLSDEYAVSKWPVDAAIWLARFL